jgi:flagellar FliL protein
MSAEGEQPKPETAAPKRGKFVLALIVTALVAGGAGATVPMFMKSSHAEKAETHAPVSEHEPLTPERTAFVPFGDVTVNLNEGRLNRYLRLKLSLQVDKTQTEIVTAKVESKKLLLRSWLLSHLSDKDQNEIRGAAGQNMLRREIREQFNELLFDDGHDRVYDVLFEEFNVQ